MDSENDEDNCFSQATSEDSFLFTEEEICKQLGKTYDNRPRKDGTPDSSDRLRPSNTMTTSRDPLLTVAGNYIFKPYIRFSLNQLIPVKSIGTNLNCLIIANR